MQMINSTRVVKATRALKAVSRAPRSIVTRAVEPPHSPAPTGAAPTGAAPTPMMTGKSLFLAFEILTMILTTHS